MAHSSNVRISLTDNDGQERFVQPPYDLTVDFEVQFDPAELDRIHDAVAESVPVVELEFQETRKVWKFPGERFIEYGPEDEDWCRGLFIGEEVEEKHLVKCRGVATAFCEDGSVKVNIQVTDSS